MLIGNADIYGRRETELRIEAGRIAAIGRLTPRPGERVVDAGGGALLPGLNDHHLHLMSFAAALDSLRCGPPEVTCEAELIAALRGRRLSSHGVAWIRGVGYHESVAGDIDRAWLDRCVPDTPTRIQHRSGRLWIINSPGLALLQDAAREQGANVIPLPDDGRLFDHDRELRGLLGSVLPPIGAASRQLAAFGVTGITDMTPDNSPDTLATFARLQADGTLLQRVRAAGTLELGGSGGGGEGEIPQALSESLRGPLLSVGPTKVHLHESSLPPFESLCSTIVASHAAGRNVAVHCVTEAELVFALAAFREASTRPGDRIEHASVTPLPLLAELQALGLLVVTQPNFVAERGDAYLADIPASEQAWLYRCRSFLDSGIALAGGTDAPFGSADPWHGMTAAVTRRTRAGSCLGPAESLTPEQALELFLGSLSAPARPRDIAVNAEADLCLLDRPWAQARTTLSSDCVRATWCRGELIFDGVD